MNTEAVIYNQQLAGEFLLRIAPEESPYLLLHENKDLADD
jgi:hypothetical protein